MRCSVRVLRFSIVIIALACLVGTARAQSLPELWVTSAAGVQRLDPDGRVAETITRTPAGHAVRRGDALVFVALEQNEVREIDLRTRAERVLATVPSDLGASCGGMWDPARSGGTFRLDDHLYFESSIAMDDDQVCLEVMDRNLNMASSVIQVRIDRRSGATSTHVAWALECPALERAEVERLPCTRLLRAAGASARGRPANARHRFPYGLDEDRGAITGRGRARRLAIVEPSPEIASRDGRWLVFSGNRDEGDYIYRQLFLLDRRTGEVYSLTTNRPIPTEAWTDAERARSEADTITGETWVGWIGDGRVLRIGALVLIPGERSVMLPGLPARE